MEAKKTNLIQESMIFDKEELFETFMSEDIFVFDKESIFEMAMYADNAQDGAILGLIFDGLSPRNAYEELIKLTIDDCNLYEQNINLNTRENFIPISAETMTLIKSAYEQEKYTSINGEKVRNYKIAEGNHVLRGIRSNKKIKRRDIKDRKSVV